MAGKFGRNRVDSGFTLYEIILVIVIISMLAFIVIPGFSSTTDQVKAQVHQANLLKMESAVKLYYLDIGAYPEAVQFLLERPPGEDNWRGPYLETLPQYPYDAGRHYQVSPGGRIFVQ